MQSIFIGEPLQGYAPHVQCYVQAERSAVHQGRLLLINREHPFMSEYNPSKLMPLTNGNGVSLRDDGIQLEDECRKQLMSLIKDSCSGDSLIVVSGYRTKEEQQHIYEHSLKENGAEYTAKYVALPNHSEHQAGLAVDVGLRADEVDFIAPDFPDSGACGEFKRLAANYGFIQRYKEGKEALTHIACEPWHFRYVGFPHALIMESRQDCLEEYVEFLKRFTFSGTRLWLNQERFGVQIYYVPAGPGITRIPIVCCDRYQLSGNNKDGFIVTAFHGKGIEFNVL